ncbi:MAG: energy transducer TonB [Gemmatimonadaceae bacterium]
MFSDLIESKPQKQRSVFGTMMSIIVHVAVILFLIKVTTGVSAIKEEKVQEDVAFVEQPKNEPPPPEPEKAPPPPDVVAAPPPPKGFQILTAPIEIPDKIPEIDLSKSVTDEADFSGKGAVGGTSKGVEGGTPRAADQPYFEFQVEKPALAREGNPSPRYPDMLKQAQIEGEVLVQFVIDTSGRAEMGTFKVLKSSHDLFTSSVRSVLPQFRFYPAETGGRKVKMFVQLPFQFALNK